MASRAKIGRTHRSHRRSTYFLVFRGREHPPHFIRIELHQSLNQRILDLGLVSTHAFVLRTRKLPEKLLPGIRIQSMLTSIHNSQLQLFLGRRQIARQRGQFLQFTSCRLGVRACRGQKARKEDRRIGYRGGRFRTATPLPPATGPSANRLGSMSTTQPN